MEQDWTVVSKKSRGTKSAPDQDFYKPKFTSLDNIYSPSKRLMQSDGGGYKNHNYDTNTKPIVKNYNNGYNNSTKFNNGGNKYNKSTFKKRDNYVPFVTEEEKKKFDTLQKEIPHIMMPGHIRKIQKTINIDDLADRMLSDEWIEYQRQGWAYEKVIKPDDHDDNPIPDGDEYDLKSLDNKWGDVVLFKRVATL